MKHLHPHHQPPTTTRSKPETVPERKHYTAENSTGKKHRDRRSAFKPLTKHRYQPETVPEIYSPPSAPN
jgi:hypothetical protein